MKLAERSIADALDFYNGKAVTLDESGEYEAFGSNGKIGFSKEFNHEHAIILGRVGAYCGSVMLSENKFWATDNTIVLKAKNSQSLRYWFYRLANFPIRSFAGGAAQPLMTHGILKGINIKVHLDIDVQERIADVLSAYDGLIENNRRRMALLEESARLLYREWFVRLRFPGHEHTSIKDGVPEGWTRKPLGDVAHMNQTSLGSTYDGEIEYIDIASVTPGVINETTPYHFRDAPSRARRVVNHGDIIWSCVRPNRRSHAVIWTPPENLVASTGFAVITPVSLPTSFLYQAVTTDLFVGYLENHAKGAAYPAVVASDFERAKVLVPVPALMNAFNEFAKPLLSQGHSLHMQSRKLRAARDLLLPRLMSGDIAV